MQNTKFAFAPTFVGASANKYIGVIGSRKLPLIYKEKVKKVVRQLLDKGFGIASGGAVGADEYALDALLELNACHRGVIFSAWRDVSQFPVSVREKIKKFLSLGGEVVWGSIPPSASRSVVVAGLLSRNIRLVLGAAGIVAFPYGESRGTYYTVRNAEKRNIPVFIFFKNLSFQNF